MTFNWLTFISSMVATQFLAFQAQALLGAVGRVSQVEPNDAEAETADVQVSNTYIYRDSEENDEDGQTNHFISFDPNLKEREIAGPELNHIFGVETKSIGTQYMY